MSLHCETCNLLFKSNKCMQAHMKSKRHAVRINKESPILDSFACCRCGKTYSYRQSLHVHNKACALVHDSPSTGSEEDAQSCKPLRLPTTTNTEELSHTNKILLETLQQKMDFYEKEREEMKAQIAMLLDKHAGTVTTNNNNNNTNNIETQHINIKITLSATKTPTTSTTNQSWRVLTACTAPFLLCWKRFILIQNIPRTITSKSPTKNSLMPPSWETTKNGKRSTVKTR